MGAEISQSVKSDLEARTLAELLSDDEVILLTTLDKGFEV